MPPEESLVLEAVELLVVLVVLELLVELVVLVLLLVELEVPPIVIDLPVLFTSPLASTTNKYAVSPLLKDP